MGQTQQSDFR